MSKATEHMHYLKGLLHGLAAGRSDLDNPIQEACEVVREELERSVEMVQPLPDPSPGLDPGRDLTAQRDQMYRKILERQVKEDHVTPYCVACGKQSRPFRQFRNSNNNKVSICCECFNELTA